MICKVSGFVALPGFIEIIARIVTVHFIEMDFLMVILQKFLINLLLFLLPHRNREFPSSIGGMREIRFTF